jgi:hypothetical protein
MLFAPALQLITNVLMPMLLLLPFAGDADAYGTIADCYTGLPPAVQQQCAVDAAAAAVCR